MAHESMMIHLSKMQIFQFAMLVYQRVATFWGVAVSPSTAVNHCPSPNPIRDNMSGW